MLLLAILMHFREAKLPVHVHVESVVGGSSLPHLTEPEHLKHMMLLSIFRNNIVPRLHRIFSVHKPEQKLHYDKKIYI